MATVSKRLATARNQIRNRPVQGRFQIRFLVELGGFEPPTF